jgi:hypothetical protein
VKSEDTTADLVVRDATNFSLDLHSQSIVIGCDTSKKSTLTRAMGRDLKDPNPGG